MQTAIPPVRVLQNGVEHRECSEGQMHLTTESGKETVEWNRNEGKLL